MSLDKLIIRLPTVISAALNRSSTAFRFWSAPRGARDAAQHVTYPKLFDAPRAGLRIGRSTRLRGAAPASAKTTAIAHAECDLRRILSLLRRGRNLSCCQRHFGGGRQRDSPKDFHGCSTREFHEGLHLRSDREFRLLLPVAVSISRLTMVGRTPWSAADAPVGLLAPGVMLIPLFRMRDGDSRPQGDPRTRGSPPPLPPDLQLWQKLVLVASRYHRLVTPVHDFAASADKESEAHVCSHRYCRSLRRG